MQLVFLLIFLVFIFLNVILGLVSSWKKRKRQAADIRRQEESVGQEPQKGDRIEEIYEEQRMHGDAGLLSSEISGESVRLVGAPSAAEEPAGTRSETLPVNSEEKPSQPSVLQEIFPIAQNVLFLHEQTADDILSPQYTLSEELSSPPEKQPEQPERGKGVSILQPTVYDTAAPYETRRSALSAVQKLEVFPPLKRAIVFSEILGTPKGLSGF